MGELLKKYTVLKREVYAVAIEVAAESPEAALLAAADNNNDWRWESMEYTHTMPVDLWTVEENK